MIKISAAGPQSFLFDWLASVAQQGGRCPTNDEMMEAFRTRGFPVTSKGGRTHLSRLIDAGMIRVEVGGKNWRIVTVLKGPFAGRATMADPRGGSIYLIHEARGSRRVNL